MNVSELVSDGLDLTTLSYKMSNKKLMNEKMKFLKFLLKFYFGFLIVLLFFFIYVSYRFIFFIEEETIIHLLILYQVQSVIYFIELIEKTRSFSLIHQTLFHTFLFSFYSYRVFQTFKKLFC